MKITTANFYKSYPKWDTMPDWELPEFAFIGRSNVGKSSLINMICQRKNLAMTSGKPGKTKLINVFDINQAWKLIDLPGYGFAKVSMRKRDKFGEMISDYLKNRRQLITAFVLIDSRHEPQAIDLSFIQWCGEEGIPFAIVFTKTDKLKEGHLSKNRAVFEAAMYQQGWEDLPPIFESSSTKHKGREDLLDYISDCLASK